MTTKLTPEPKRKARKKIARHVRHDAAGLRYHIPHPDHLANGDIADLGPEAPMTFTKGLAHDEFGVADDEALDRFVKFLNQSYRSGFGYSDPTGSGVPLGPQKAYRGEPGDPPLPSHPSGYQSPATMVADFKTKKNKKDDMYKLRAWESPLAGHVYDLEGPDADALTMPPAPPLGSGELTAEIAEVYALALLRDKPFTDIVAGTNGTDTAINALKAIPWFEDAANPENDAKAEKRRKARLDAKGKLTAAVAFRGSTAGAKVGPYLSQFMLIGNAGRGEQLAAESSTQESATSGTIVPVQSSESAPTAQNFRGMASLTPDYSEIAKAAADFEKAAKSGDDAKMEAAKESLAALVYRVRKANDGYILYGAQEISQQVSGHDEKDYMTNWNDWTDIQSGKDAKNEEGFKRGGRFITTPRDLATYVHFDQLYQAYLNACLLMLGYGMPHDGGFPEGGKSGTVRDAFATFGGPHILSLLTEVATRSLKFARRQKFNIHLRARPEALAGLLAVAGNSTAKEAKDRLGEAGPKARKMVTALSGLLGQIDAKNGNPAGNPAWLKKNYLLPMAFSEGSPMHPSYGAGHATVAGACVTILKAFFEMFETKSMSVEEKWTELPFKRLYGATNPDRKKAFRDGKFTTGLFVPESDAQSLRQLKTSEVTDPITILGELDKLAANISIGRDMAGVHYYTDYYESMRLGERVAVGILQEQMLTYPEPVTMRLKSFDGHQLLIDGKGDGKASVVNVGKPVYKADGSIDRYERILFEEWWDQTR